MCDFTRDNEHSLDLLQKKREVGHLESDESRVLQELERRYELFVQQGLQKLERMAPRKVTPLLRLWYTLVSWPMLWLFLCLFFVVLYLLRCPECDERIRILLQWHLGVVGLLLIGATLVGFTRIREHSLVTTSALCFCVVTELALILATVILLLYQSGVDGILWDGRMCAITGGADGMILLEALLLLLDRF